MADIKAYFETLHRAWGPQHWWPAETAFEVIIGAILTQNTAWTNVEKALANLREANALSFAGIRDLPTEELEQLIRPSGYFRQKAARLKGFVDWLDKEYEGSLRRMFARPTSILREELLALNGIGPETADSILLYAGNHEIFVVDAYTKRIFERHGLIHIAAKYEEVRTLVEQELRKTNIAPGRRIQPSDEAPPVHPPSPMSEASRSALAQTYNEFHGLIVQVGKHFCLAREAKCERCPLRPLLPGADK